MILSMYHFFNITTFSILVIVAYGELCKEVNDESVSSLTEKFFQTVSEDALNVTKHIDEYVATLRETVKNEHLPPGLVKYYLFTSETLKNPYNLTSTTKGSFKKVPFNNKKPLVFGIHGYTRKLSLTSGNMGALVQTLVELNEYNVIFVDYTELTDNVLSIVTPKAYLAAKQISEFLRFLMDETGTKREQIHLIGISLGGQMSGIIGGIMPGIGRISGLDPGGSFFDGFPEDLRLDRGDANFVDVIHMADASPIPKGWGYYKPCGHLDFYFNGGKFQPGCGSTMPGEQMPTTLKEKQARVCMHDRMIIYYTESMCKKCSFVGTMCESYEKYKKGMCNVSNSRSAIMGEYATKPLTDLPEDAMFFLDTNAQYPFCISPQQKQSSILNKLLNFFFYPLTFFQSLF